MLEIHIGREEHEFISIKILERESPDSGMASNTLSSPFFAELCATIV
jgi:hypothetical protein